MNASLPSPTPLQRILQGIQGLCMMVLTVLVPLAIVVWLMTRDEDAAVTEAAVANDPTAGMSIRAIAVSADEQHVDVIQGQTRWRRHDAHTGVELGQFDRPGLNLLKPQLNLSKRFCAGVREPGELFVFEEAGVIAAGPLPGQQPREPIAGCSICPQRNLLAAVSERGSLWLLEFDGNVIVSQRSYVLGQPMRDVEFSPAGDRLALGTARGEILLWDLDTERFAADWPAPSHCRAVVWSGDGRRLMGLGHTRLVRVWNADAGDLVSQWDAGSSIIAAGILSLSGRLAAVGEDSAIRILDLETGQEQAVLNGHRGIVKCLLFADDDRALFSADSKGELRRWSVADARELWMTDGAEVALRQ